MFSKTNIFLSAMLLFALFLGACGPAEPGQGGPTEDCNISFDLILNDVDGREVFSQHLGDIALTANGNLINGILERDAEIAAWFDAAKLAVAKASTATKAKLPAIEMGYKTSSYDASGKLTVQTKDSDILAMLKSYYAADLRYRNNGSCSGKRVIQMFYKPIVLGPYVDSYGWDANTEPPTYLGFYSTVAVNGENLAITMVSPAPERGRITFYQPRSLYDNIVTATLNGTPLPEYENKVDYTMPAPEAGGEWYKNVQSLAEDEAGSFSFSTTDVNGRKVLLPILADALNIAASTREAERYQILWSATLISGESVSGSFSSTGSLKGDGWLFLLFGGVQFKGSQQASGGYTGETVQIQTGQLYYVPVSGSK